MPVKLLTTVKNISSVPNPTNAILLREFYEYMRSNGISEILPNSEWITPAFAKIKEKRTKRLSPYLGTQLWERDEILTIIKYEPSKRNKAALSLLWDLNARNHEVTLLATMYL